MIKRTNRILTLVFGALIAVNLGYLVLGFLSIPRYYERVTTLTIHEPSVAVASYPTNESVVQSAAAQGLTLPQYAVTQIIFHSALVVLFLAVAVVVLLRAGQNWFVWYSAFFMVFIAEYALFNEVYVASLVPLWVYEAGSLFWPLILPYFFLFPNGKPAPRQGLWVVLPAFLLHAILQTTGFFLILSPDAVGMAFFESIGGIVGVSISGVFLFILGCQVYRYLRVSSKVEKQQTKWFLMGFAALLALSTVSDGLGDANPYRAEIGLAIFAFMPLSLAVAILRYRLWDIDILIRRTLQYTLLSGLLALIYFGGVVTLQSVLGPLTGQADSPLVAVLTTLSVAALFSPLRRRVQEFIDRRFYRQKYDAEQALAEFAAAARAETDLAQLSERLTGTVQQALQPEQVSVWLRPNKKPGGK